MQADTPHTLTRSEVDKFHEEGYLDPYPLCTPKEMGPIRKHIEDEVLCIPTVWGGGQYQTRHLVDQQQ